MTQRDLVKVAAGIVIGAAAAVAIGLVLGKPLGQNRDKQTEVILSPEVENGPCASWKAPIVRANTSTNLTWDITNYCTDAKTVAVGNFRRTEATEAPRDCKVEGPAYPFTDASEETRTSHLDAAETGTDGIKPTKGRIKLKVKDRSQLEQGELTYYFDVCVGGIKIDPKLVIER